jgi:hypothetical protein
MQQILTNFEAASVGGLFLFKLRRDVGSWHIAAFAAVRLFGRYWTNSGQRSVLGLDHSAAIDPNR